MTDSRSATLLAILVCGGLAGCAGLPSGSDASGPAGSAVDRPSAGAESAAAPFERRGAAQRRAGRFDAAEASFRRALEIDADSIAAREGLGLVHLQRDNLALAEVMLGRVLELDDDRVSVLNALGVLRDRQGRHVDAQSRYREALTLDGDDASIVNNLGYSLLLDGDLAKAELELERAVRIDPSLDIGWSNLALVRSRAGDRPGARAALSRVGGEQKTLNNIALLDLLSGDERAARASLQASLDSSPGYYAPARRNLALLDESPRARSNVFERAGLVDIPNGSSGRVATPVPKPVASGRAVDDDTLRSDTALLAGVAAPRRTRSILLDGGVGVAAVVGAGAVEDSGDASEQRADRDPDDEPIGTESDATSASNDPVDDLTKDIVREVQTRLVDQGFEAGPADGVVGDATTRAVRLFKVARGLPVDSSITPRLVEELRR